MQTTSVTKQFLQAMHSFSKENMDDFFENNKNEHINTSLASYTYQKAFFKLIKYVFTSSVLICLFVFNSSSLDMIAKLISATFLISVSFFLSLTVIFLKVNERFKYLKEEAVNDLMKIKKDFLYNHIKRQAIFDSIPNSQEFFGAKRFKELNNNCEIMGLSNDDLYFIFKCVNNEYYYGLFLVFNALTSKPFIKLEKTSTY